MKIAVFCGSTLGKTSEFCDMAIELGRWIAEKGHTLVYGSSDVGLMGVIAKAVHDAGGWVIGVIPEDVPSFQHLNQPYVSELIHTKDMSERKSVMEELADIFIALPGGIGTIDEISETITLDKLGVINKPSIIYDRTGFYKPFKELLENMEREGFLTEEIVARILFAKDVGDLDSFMMHNVHNKTQQMV